MLIISVAYKSVVRSFFQSLRRQCQSVVVQVMLILGGLHRGRNITSQRKWGGGGGGGLVIIHVAILFNYQLSKSGGARAPPPAPQYLCHWGSRVSFRIGTGRSISTFEICLKVHFISYSLGLNYNTMQQISVTKLQWLLQQGFLCQAYG